MFDYIKDRFKPEMFYVEALRRRAWWVLEFKNVAEELEFGELIMRKRGTYPTFIPLMTGSEVDDVFVNAAQEAKNVSKG